MPTAPNKFIHNWIILYNFHSLESKKWKTYLFQKSMREEAKRKVLGEYATALD